MSKRPRNKTDKAQVDKGPRERPEEPQLEKPQAEEPRSEEPKTEGSRTEGPQSEEPRTEGSRTEEPRSEEQPKRSKGKTNPPPSPKKAKPEKSQWIIMIVMIVLAVVMVIAAALALLHNRWFKKPPLPPSPGPSASGSVPSSAVPSISPGLDTTSGIVTVEPLAGGKRKSEDYFTVLIFGMDESSGLTDTIMVASYDVTNQKATVLSIPRDTLINNRYLDKANKSINATYKQNGKGESGVEALKTEVSRLIGFVPDFYVTINWNLVGQMVEAIGSVEFEVPWRMKYDDPFQNLHIDLMPGLQTLDGEHAMQLVRWRKNNPGVRGGGDGSDLSRLNVQHSFLKAVLKQTLQPQNIIRIPELIRLFNEHVVSDLAVENMLWFGEQAVLGGLNVDDVAFINLPVYATDNRSARYYGRYSPIIDKLLAVVNESVNPYVEDVTLQQLDLIQMSTDGNILSSTTGTLRNPSCGVYEYPDNPTTSDPPEDDPEVTDPPEDDPEVTDPPEDGPEVTDPPENDPEATDPPEDGPGQTDNPSPETGPTLPDGDGPDDGNWGYTPD